MFEKKRNSEGARQTDPWSNILKQKNVLGRMVLETASQLEADLGGDLSTAQRMLVNDAALDTLLLAALNNEVADSSPIIKAKGGEKAHPVYQLRAQLISQRRETLKLLYPPGFKRVSAKVNDLDEYCKKTYGNRTDDDTTAEPTEQDGSDG